MNRRSSFMLGAFGLMLLAGGGNAVDLNLNFPSGSCQLPIAPGSQVTVHPATGDVTVQASGMGTCGSFGGGVPLSVSLSGSGTVRINGSPTVADCASTCTVGLASGSGATLTATAAAGWSFSGWSGDCTGTGSCSLVMSGARSVTAMFTSSSPTVALTVVKSGTGSGTVTSTPSGISCGTSCASANASFTAGTAVTLTATPASASSFTGWNGVSCSGGNSSPTCSFVINSNLTVTAGFSGASSTPPGCAGVSAPTVVGTRMATTVVKVSPGYADQTVNAHFFAQLFRKPDGTDVPWPGNTQTRLIRIGKNAHIAAEFTVPTSTSLTTWELMFNNHGDVVPNYPGMVTVTACPGNFNTSGPHAVDTRCVWPFGYVGSMFFEVVSNAAAYTGFRCPLEKGQTYYLNMAHYNPNEPTQPACTGPTECSVFLKANH